jgi:RNA recognition motif-containing protein
VVYLGHIPHGFLEEQIKSYFSQYGEVLGVKVARSRATARSKGYAFVQFKYPEVAEIVSDTMNGYLLMGKVLVSNVLPATHKNPFCYATSGKYRFINWKHLFIQQNKQVPLPPLRPKPTSRLPIWCTTCSRRNRKSARSSQNSVSTTNSPVFPPMCPSQKPSPRPPRPRPLRSRRRASDHSNIYHSTITSSISPSRDRVAIGPLSYCRHSLNLPYS